LPWLGAGEKRGISEDKIAYTLDEQVYRSTVLYDMETISNKIELHMRFVTSETLAVVSAKTKQLGEYVR
jgi:hypothetical protein